MKSQCIDGWNEPDFWIVNDTLSALKLLFLIVRLEESARVDAFRSVTLHVRAFEDVFLQVKELLRATLLAFRTVKLELAGLDEDLRRVMLELRAFEADFRSVILNEMLTASSERRLKELESARLDDFLHVNDDDNALLLLLRMVNDEDGA